MKATTPYEIQFLAALTLTDAIETVLLFALVRAAFNVRSNVCSNTRLLFAGVFCSSGTLPYLWFVLPRLLPSYVWLVILGELFVFLLEAVFYYFVLEVGVKRAILLSFLCNLASILGGLLFL